MGPERRDVPGIGGKGDFTIESRVSTPPPPVHERTRHVRTRTVPTNRIGTPSFPVSKPVVRETPAVPKEEPMPEKKRAGRLKTIARRAGLTVLSLLGIAAPVGPAVHHHITSETELSPPAIGRDIASVPSFYADLTKSGIERVRRLFNRETVVPPTYDNAITETPQAIKAGVNAISVTRGELPSVLKNSIKPLEESKLPNNVAILLPIQLDTDQTIGISKHEVLSGSPNTGQEVEVVGVDTLLTISKSGTQIIVPVEQAEVFRAGPWTVNGVPYFNGVFLRFTGPDKVIYTLSIGAKDDVRHLRPMDIIKDAPILTGKLGSPDSAQQDIIIVTAGTSIMETASPQATIGIVIRAYHPEDAGYGWKYVNPNVNLLVDNNGAVLYLPR